MGFDVYDFIILCIGFWEHVALTFIDVEDLDHCWIIFLLCWGLVPRMLILVVDWLSNKYSAADFYKMMCWIK